MRGSGGGGSSPASQSGSHHHHTFKRASSLRQLVRLSLKAAGARPRPSHQDKQDARKGPWWVVCALTAHMIRWSKS
ncbi:hypothetical protein SORBI_3004G315850 [Sorghum bicolor]|uniref:Uncharacterized protein n=1 Tax=Sorghum bicolor TaxID=4558 RepID=A0A1Z5RQE4_SORBI|nr:hypothetical protein SORBI_3004G315850 [Sorghum bicolor]